jgi:hypothetical protein
MTEEQIDSIFNLLSTSKSTTRENIKSLYLDRIGDSIIDYCIKHFEITSKADVKCDYLRFVIQYAKTDNRVTDFAKKALADKSKKVRQKALSILAFSTNTDFLSLLESQRQKLKGNEDDIENAINAIKAKNHNLFYPNYDRWSVTRADKYRHLKREQFTEDVKLYIEKYGKEAVPELKRILGNLYE